MLKQLLKLFSKPTETVELRRTCGYFLILERNEEEKRKKAAEQKSAQTVDRQEG